MDQIFRVGGGYTAFTFNGRPLAYLEVINDQAPQPVAQPEPVQPLDAEHPVEIAFPMAHGPGTLQLTIREQWGEDIWDQIPQFRGADNIIEVFRRNLDAGNIVCQKIIRKPGGGTRVVTYHGVVVSNIDESETVEVRTMTLPKRLTLMYTHRTKKG